MNEFLWSCLGEKTDTCSDPRFLYARVALKLDGLHAKIFISARLMLNINVNWSSVT